MKSLPKSLLLIAAIISLATLSSFAVQRYMAEDKVISDPIVMRPEFAIADLNGQVRNIKEWDGQVILLNFWATWCPPCLSEIPGFIELQDQYGEQGFQVVGIAIDEEEAVREFVARLKINYPVMAAEYEALELSSRYGNQMGALPYSVFINRKGEISDKITGELSKIEAETMLKKLGFKP
ncbi:MAG: TlpA disulfide reductase family protein [Gammaproteobacteria bacterium]|jgi:thiol-disulfide isomerase/thioredoxin|nr:TlpA disulfide reductase family protein [Gammaproteobacteria bacterium]